MDNYKPRLEKLYLENYRSSLKDQFKYKNDLMIPKIDKVVVEGINSVITHRKQTKDTAGGRVPKNAPVHVSNVALLDPKNDVATRVGFSVKDGKKVRIAKNSGEVIDG